MLIIVVYLHNCLEFKNKIMWHRNIGVNRIVSVVLSSSDHCSLGVKEEGNPEVKRAGAGGWVTDREVWPWVQFDLRLSILRVKNVINVRDWKKLKKNLNFFFWIFLDQTDVHGTTPRAGLRRRPPSAYTGLRRGPAYADGPLGYAEAHLRRGATPTGTLGVAYADGKYRLRRGLWAVGVSAHSRSESRIQSLP